MIRVLALALAALAVAPAAEAQGKGHCPPGLARKNPPCVPPGQARKGGYDDDDRYRVGDRFDRDRYDRIRDWDRYRLPPLREGEVYYRDGTVVYRVDRDTRAVLQILEGIATLSN